MSGILSSLQNAGNTALNNTAYYTLTTINGLGIKGFASDYKTVQEAPAAHKALFIGGAILAVIGATALTGAAIAGTGLALGYAAPLTGSATFVTFAAKTTAFGKATAVFPYTAAKASYLFVAPKVASTATWTFANVISPAATGTKYYLGEAAVKISYGFNTWVIPGASKTLDFTVAAFKAPVPAGSLVPTFGFGAVAGYFYGRPATPAAPAASKEAPAAPEKALEASSEAEIHAASKIDKNIALAPASGVELVIDDEADAK